MKYFLLLLPITFFFIACEGPISPEYPKTNTYPTNQNTNESTTNTPPVISDFRASSSSIFVSESTSITTTAYDFNTNDSLSYAYTLVSGKGSLSANGAVATYTAPNEATIALINVSVSDGKTNTNASLAIEVRLKESTDTNWQFVGLAGFSPPASLTKLEHSSLGKLYVAFADTNGGTNAGYYGISVAVYENTNWVILGESNFAQVLVGSTPRNDRIAFALNASNIPFVACVSPTKISNNAYDTRTSLVLYYYEDTSWKVYGNEIAVEDGVDGYIDLDFDTSFIPYISFSYLTAKGISDENTNYDATLYHRASLVKYNPTRNSWDNFGMPNTKDDANQIYTAVYPSLNPMLFYLIASTYLNENDDGAIVCYQYDTTNQRWSLFSSTNINAQKISFERHAPFMYESHVSSSAEALIVRRFYSGVWSNVGPSIRPDTVTNSFSKLDYSIMTVSSNTPYVVYADYNSLYGTTFTAYKYDSAYNSFRILGDIGFALGDFLSLTHTSVYLHASYIDFNNNSKVSVKKFKKEE